MDMIVLHVLDLAARRLFRHLLSWMPPQTCSRLLALPHPRQCWTRCPFRLFLSLVPPGQPSGEFLEVPGPGQPRRSNLAFEASCPHQMM